jgi:hypothetical protein
MSIDEELLAMEALHGPLLYDEPSWIRWRVGGVIVRLQQAPCVRVELATDEGGGIVSEALRKAVAELDTAQEYLLASVVALVEQAEESGSTGGVAAVQPAACVLPSRYMPPIRPYMERLAPRYCDNRAFSVKVDHLGTHRMHDTAGLDLRFSFGSLRWSWVEFPPTVDFSALKIPPGTACLSYPTTGNVYFFVDGTETIVLHTGMGRMQKRGMSLRQLTVSDVPGVSVSVSALSFWCYS